MSQKTKCLSWQGLKASANVFQRITLTCTFDVKLCMCARDEQVLMQACTNSLLMYCQKCILAHTFTVKSNSSYTHKLLTQPYISPYNDKRSNKIG